MTAGNAGNAGNAGGVRSVRSAGHATNAEGAENPRGRAPVAPVDRPRRVRCYERPRRRTTSTSAPMTPKPFQWEPRATRSSKSQPRAESPRSTRYCPTA